MMSIDEESSRVRSDSIDSANGQALNSKLRLVDKFRNRSLSMGYHDLSRVSLI